MKIFQDLLRRFFKSRLFVGSFIMTLGTGLGGGLNYIYHLLMGRMLGPSDYGVLVSLISLFYILSIPLGTFTLVMVKFVSLLKGKKDFDSISGLFKVITKRILPLSLFVFLVLLLLTPLVTSFLHLSSYIPFIIVLGGFFIGIFSTVNRAFLQGLLRFGFISVGSILGTFTKLTLAVLLVFLGFKVNGALAGFLLGGIVVYLFTLFPLRFLFKKNLKKINLKTKDMFRFALPVFFSTLAFTSLFTIDIILVRHFLPNQQAGFYAALSTLGKIIFFLAGPVIHVVFPMISEKHSSGKNYRNVFLASIGLVGAISFSVTAIYFLLPNLMVKLLYGSEYLSIVPYLGFFGVFLSFYSLSFLMINFFLSVGKVKAVIFPVVAALLQIILISIFHSNLFQIISISVLLSTVLFVSLLLNLIKCEAELNL